jgi:hypothetical protein
MARDPTKTGKLRQMFRGEAQRKLRTLLTATREMLVEQNALGNVHHPMMLIGFFRQQLPSEQGGKLEIFTRWFNNAIYSILVQDGRWLQEHAYRAYGHGLRAGEQWSKRPLASNPGDLFLKFYRNELEGIADVTVQQVTRAISNGLLNREAPATIYRRVVAVSIKTTEPRLRALGHQIIVQMHNLGIAAQLKSVGVTQVNVIPETLAPRFAFPRRDAIKDQEEVNILTAGDDDVCDECEDYAEAGPYELEDVEAELPLHPNCRCAWVPTYDMRFAINRVRREKELEAEE